MQVYDFEDLNEANMRSSATNVPSGDDFNTAFINIDCW